MDDRISRIERRKRRLGRMASDCLVFSQGQTATITAQFVTTSGMAVDVPDATVEIFGEGGSVILAATAMMHVVTGFYFLDYVIPSSLPANTYTIRITGTVLGIPSATTQLLQVLPAGTPTGATLSQRKIELVVALESYIGCAQRIPVYNELARRNKDRDRFQLTWPRWNLSNHEIRLNGDIVDDGFSLNFDTGTVVFTAPRIRTDTIHATYNFRFFTQVDELRFLNDALNQINLEPPGSSFTLDNLPEQYVGVLMRGAAKNAIQALLFCLQFQEIQTIFGGADRAQQITSSFQALKENHEKEFERDKKTIKKAVYPRIGVIVTPSYTLPGGRSRWFRYLFSSNIG